MTKAHSAQGSGINNYVTSLFDPTLEWNDIKWLQTITKLPIILKGILRGDDAQKAADLGVAGVMVSNHGARQIDGTPASVSNFLDSKCWRKVLKKGWVID